MRQLFPKRGICPNLNASRSSDLPVCASCCSISPTRRRCHWWDRSSGRLPQGSHRDDVDLYHRRTGGHAADRASGRVQGRCLGAKAAVSPGLPSCPFVLCSARPSDNSLWLIGVQVLDGVGGSFRRAGAPGDRRYHARRGPLQSRPGRDRHGAGDRRFAGVGSPPASLSIVSAIVSHFSAWAAPPWWP